LGIDVAGERQKEQIYSRCQIYLESILKEISWDRWNPAEQCHEEYINTQNQIGVQPFILEKKIDS